MNIFRPKQMLQRLLRNESDFTPAFGYLPEKKVWQRVKFSTAVQRPQFSLLGNSIFRCLHFSFHFLTALTVRKMNFPPKTRGTLADVVMMGERNCIGTHVCRAVAGRLRMTRLSLSPIYSAEPL